MPDLNVNRRYRGSVDESVRGDRSGHGHARGRPLVRDHRADRRRRHSQGRARVGEETRLTVTGSTSEEAERMLRRVTDEPVPDAA